MAGCVSRCKQCGKDLWDEDTAKINCVHCGKPHRELPDLEKLVELKVKLELDRRFAKMMEK